MHRFSLTLLGLLAVAVVAIHPLPDVSGHLDRALEEVQQSLAVVKKYIRKQKKKVTPSSKFMAIRNKVATRAVANLKEEGVGSARASRLVKRALQKHGLRPAGFGGFKEFMETSQEELVCDRAPVCDTASPFRTFTGECNNFGAPLYGAVDIEFRRFVPPAYADGLSVPRGGFVTLEDIEQGEEEEEEEGEEGEEGEGGKGKGGKGKGKGKGLFLAGKGKGKGKGKGGKGKGGKGKGGEGGEGFAFSTSLPLPRFISTSFFPDFNLPSTNLAHMFMQFGQFTDHDLTLAPEEEIEECCEEPEQEGCFPVVIPLNDTFFSAFDQNCFQFTRSVPFCEDGTGVRQQFNAITGFLDSSNVYGSTDAQAALLRSNVNGLLASNTNFPAIPGIIPALGPDGSLLAGDPRVGEQPGLTTIHNLFFREHNRLARAIFAADATLTDEAIFQLARRLVNAQWQNIMFTEFLPIVLGPAAMATFNLALPTALGGFTTYDPAVDPSIVHAFATAAFRFGHSLIQGAFNLNSPAAPGTPVGVGSFQLCENFDNFAIFLGGNAAGADNILTGLVNQPAQTFDRFITDNLTNHLFPENAEFGSLGAFGMDLMARNIQRGREHGLPGYVSYRAFCNLPAFTSFAPSARPADISVANFALLASIYPLPADIDLWVGGLAETPVAGGLIGPTFNCIQATQFQRLMVGDRFFFTHGGQTGSFTSAQLTILRQRTMRDIICCNSPIVAVNTNALLTTGTLTPCTTGNPLDVAAFLNLPATQ